MNAAKTSVKAFFLSLLIISGIATRSTAETIDVTDKQGRTITAKLVRFDGKNINIFRVSDSKTFTIPLDTLDEKTTTAVNLWVKKGGNLVTDFEVSMNTGKSNRTTGSDDFDDKRVNLKPVISVKNTHTTMESKPAQITAVFLGRPVKSRTNIYVFATETFDLPKLAPLGSIDFRCKPVSEAYDNRGYAQFGSRYLGYVWIIHNNLKTEIIASGSVPSNFGNKNLLNFFEMKPDRYYTDNLLPVNN